MKSTRLALMALLAGLLFHSVASAQPLINESHQAQGQNVRAAYAIDAKGNVDGDDYEGFYLAYASKIYPLDQMVISYTQLSPADSTMNQVTLAVEEYWPLTDWLVPYGTAGFGYIWIDYQAGLAGDSTGWFGKVGGGILVKTGTMFDVYAEVAYMASDRDLWIDGSVNSDSDNTQVLLGVRMNY